MTRPGLASLRALTRPVADYRLWLRRDPCAYCGKRVKRMSTDHIHPIARGGRNHWENYTAACRACNCQKGTRSLLQYLVWRQRDGQRILQRGAAPGVRPETANGQREGLPLPV